MVIFIISKISLILFSSVVGEWSHYCHGNVDNTCMLFVIILSGQSRFPLCVLVSCNKGDSVGFCRNQSKLVMLKQAIRTSFKSLPDIDLVMCSRLVKDM